ncbi:unnamed protein product [Sphagnum balticum]
MVAMWYCCDCGLLNESTHHNAVYCHWTTMCVESAATQSGSRRTITIITTFTNDSHGVRRATKLKLFTTIMIRVMKRLFKLAHHHNHDLHKRFSWGATRHKTKAIHHHHDTRYEMAVQIGSNFLAGILLAAITSAACSLM